MVVGVSEVFDKMSEYLKKNYPDLESFTMPYCSLSENEKGKHYRIQISFKRKGQTYPQTAIALADAETGNIIKFEEGFIWRFWI